MPQIVMKLSPFLVLSDPNHDSDRRSIGKKLIYETEAIFKIVGENDVTFIASPLLSFVNEVDVQVEVRYTVGEDEYNRGEPFEPTSEQKKILKDELLKILGRELPPEVRSYSVWIIPYHGTEFEMVDR